MDNSNDNFVSEESFYKDSSVTSSPEDQNSSDRKDKNLESKVCGVCGDKALGNNFNAVTCESCKAFFRRNALKTKAFSCPFNDNCKMDPVTRRFCQKCRLKKCVDIGMKKEWIMSEEEKRQKKRKIEQNRLKRQSSDAPETPAPPPAKERCKGPSEGSILKASKQPMMPSNMQNNPGELPAPFLLPNPPNPLQNYPLQSPIQTPQGTGIPDPGGYHETNQVELGQPQETPEGSLLSSLIRPNLAESPPDENLIDCRTSHFNKEEEESNQIEYPIPLQPEGIEPRNEPDPPSVSLPDYGGLSFLDAGPLPLNTMDSILSVAITAEFNSFGVLGRGLTPSGRGLNKLEEARLRELFCAGQALNDPVESERPLNMSEISDQSLINVINLTDLAIRRLIKMSKKISGFKNMCQEDQIALLKGGCTEMMILRSVVSYDPDKDSWNIPSSNRRGYNINLGILKEAGGNLYEEHQRFIRSFRTEWRADENIMTILCAITLFTPERPGVIHKDVVKLEQDSYYYLLKRYLESILTGCEATSTYLSLIRKIAELHVLNSKQLRVFLEVNPREVEPLLIEIFDLKQ